MIVDLYALFGRERGTEEKKTDIDQKIKDTAQKLTDPKRHIKPPPKPKLSPEELRQGIPSEVQGAIDYLRHREQPKEQEQPQEQPQERPKEQERTTPQSMVKLEQQKGVNDQARATHEKALKNADKSQLLKAEILKGMRAGADNKESLKKACECIALMTGDYAFNDTAQETIK